jgi:hypothetical protein
MCELWDIERFFDVSWRRHGSTLWIKVWEQEISGLELEFGRFVRARNYRTAIISGVNITAVLETNSELFRSSVRGSWRTAVGQIMSRLKLSV